MLKLRKSKDRGHANHGWLESRHTFSFGDYHDEENMGFRDLRVINEDRVQPAMGFGTHGHRDMEIISYVVAGSLEHKDSMGNGSVIRPGDVQYMSAGSGVTHSEFNASKAELVYFLQIWIIPNLKGAKPQYDQKHFEIKDRLNQLRLVASPSGEQGSIAIRQEAKIFASILDEGQKLNYDLANQRHAWIQLVSGSVKVNGETLMAGDGLAISDVTNLKIESLWKMSEFLFFDLP